MREKRILVVEDEKIKAAEIIGKLYDKGLKANSTDNKEDAIRIIRNSLPDVVVLDLRIYEKNEQQGGPDRIYGKAIIEEIINLNNSRDNLNIQIVLATASGGDDFTKGILQLVGSILTLIDKKTDNFYDNVVEAVENALACPRSRVVVIEYKGFDEKLLKELREVSEFWWNILLNDIFIDFKEEKYRDCILDSASFVKCLYKEFTMDIKKAIENMNLLYQEGKEEEKEKNEKKGNQKVDWLTVWDNLVEKDIIREIDKQCAVCVIRARNKPAHRFDDGKGYSKDDSYDIDDAATVLQLLVPLVKRYIKFKKNK